MNNEEINDWSESLRTKLGFFSALACAFYGIVTLLIFGSMALGQTEPSDFLHVLFFALGSFGLSLFIYHNILVRQLALPGAIAGAIYSYLNYQGSDLYLYFNICALIVITVVVIGLTEARATTGKFTDFWRSFLYHPLGWNKHMGINTLLK